MNNRTVCWPAEWLEAAVKVGLAKRIDGGVRINNLTGDDLRDVIGAFAAEIVDIVHTLKQVLCVKGA